MTDVTSYPLESKVVLHGLKAEEFNGKEAIVKSELKDGRQQVLIGKKFLNIKPTNFKFPDTPIESLSLKELKIILKEKNPDLTFTGMDASDLRKQVAELGSLDEIQYTLAVANEKALIEKNQEKEKAAAAAKNKKEKRSTTHASGNSNSSNNRNEMSPDQLRQQARAMRSMPPDQIRRMNPQLRHMTNAQIMQAAEQMEQMAENPESLRQANHQMQNMTPQEMERAAQQQQQQQPQSLTDLTPEQLLQQAQSMRSMTKDQIRTMNPQLAGMSDAEIEQSIQQMEVMATNPAMFEMAKNQMKDMKPEDVANLQRQQQQQAGGNNKSAGGLQQKKLSEMSGKQIKEMLAMLKQNPNAFQSMLPPGMTQEQFQKSFGMFENMDEEQLDSVIGMMQRYESTTAPVRQAWNSVNSVCGGHLAKVLIILVLLAVGSLVYVRFVLLAAGPAEATLDTLQQAVEEPPLLEHDDDDQEF